MNPGKALLAFARSTKSNVKRDLALTKRLADRAAKDPGWSLTIPFLEYASKNGAPGASSLLNANRKMHYYIHRTDTALGSALRGNSKPGSFRNWLFTKKEYVPLVNGKIDMAAKNPDTYRLIERPSISRPVEGAAGLVGMGLAADKIQEWNKNRRVT